MTLNSLAGAREEPQQIDVNCYCKTKEVAGWCGTNLGDNSTIQWSEKPFVDDKSDWNEEKIRAYCFRKSNAACLCKDEVSLYSGESID